MARSSDRDRIPYIPPTLPDVLSERWPDRCPSPNDEERRIWMAAGAQEVIRYLRERVEDQSRRQME